MADGIGPSLQTLGEMFTALCLFFLADDLIFNISGGTETLLKGGAVEEINLINGKNTSFYASINF